MSQLECFRRVIATLDQEVRALTAQVSQAAGAVTFTACPTLAYFERHGLDESIQCCCGVDGVEERCFKEYARIVNPKIRCKGLKYAPRKSPQDIACQWEFWTEK